VSVEAEHEAARVRAVLRDLLALSAMPGVWVGKDAPAVATGLADAVFDLLRLDFVFVRLSEPGGAGADDVTRGNAWPRFPDWLEGHLAATAHPLRKEIVPDVGGGSQPCRGFVMPVGVNGDEGVVAAACSREDFPTPIDEMLLSLAANHAATAFQSARLIHQLRRAEEEPREARDELEVNVADRTAELEKLAGEQAALRRVATLGEEGVREEFLLQVNSAIPHKTD
jgi:hypothetical protein